MVSAFYPDSELLGHDLIHPHRYLSELRRTQTDHRHGLLRVPPAYHRLLRVAEKYMAFECIREIVYVFHEVWPTCLLAWQEKEVARMKKAYESAPSTLADEQEPPTPWDQTNLLPDPGASIFLYSYSY